jgi:hypothetical protein
MSESGVAGYLGFLSGLIKSGLLLEACFKEIKPTPQEFYNYLKIKSLNFAGFLSEQKL